MESFKFIIATLLICLICVRTHNLAICDRLSQLFIGEEKLLDFSRLHSQNEITVGIHLHVVSGKCGKEKIEKWANFNLSRLRSDWTNTSGISFVV